MRFSSICLTVLLFLAVIFSQSVYAQTKISGETFSVYAVTGYGFSSGGYHVGSSLKTLDGAHVEAEDYYLNYGRGIKGEAGINYLLMEHMVGQFSFEFSGGVPSISIIDETRYTGRVDGEKETINHHFKQWGFKMALMPKFQALGLLDMYTGVGCGLFFASHSADLTYEVIDGAGIKVTSNATIEYENYPAFAFIGLLGAEIPVYLKATAFAELSFEQMNFTLSKSTRTPTTYASHYDIDVIQYTKNGLDQNDTPIKTPGSNVAIRIGIRYALF